MSDIAIRVEGLGKRYRLGSRAPYHRFSDLVTGYATAPARWARRAFSRPAGGDSASAKPAPPGDFWALRDVNLEIKHGEVVGIIGRNGAGKSTLLKILSRITEPTCGRATIHGRIGSLLEVGTGFHPELTGRENIFLNGAILGMTRGEIKRKFDEIVAFAEVEQFLDTPVKRYSSGMYMRLAFAVAAHLEPEILIVDEVLAVGDAQFQKKCLGKMGEVAKGGRTVLFVSHQMAAIENLCRSCVLLDSGRIESIGESRRTIKKYLESNRERDTDTNSLATRVDRSGDGTLRIIGFRLLDEAGVPLSSLRSGDSVTWEIIVENATDMTVRGVELAIGLDDALGTRIAHISSDLCGTEPQTIATGGGAIHVEFPRWPLGPGRYGLTFFLTSHGRIVDWVRQGSFIDVDGGDFFQTGKLPDPSQGSLLIEHRIYSAEVSPYGA